MIEYIVTISVEILFAIKIRQIFWEYVNGYFKKNLVENKSLLYIKPHASNLILLMKKIKI